MDKDGIISELGTVGAGTPGMKVGPVIGGGSRRCHQTGGSGLTEIDSMDFSNLAGDQALAIHARVASSGGGIKKITALHEIEDQSTHFVGNDR